MASTIAKTPTGIRKINTKIWEDNGVLAVQLYQTVVYREDANTIELNHGGWVTPTTASRIRQALWYRGHSERVHIKNDVMCCNGVPFDRDKFTIVKVG